MVVLGMVVIFKAYNQGGLSSRVKDRCSIRLWLKEKRKEGRDFKM